MLVMYQNLTLFYTKTRSYFLWCLQDLGVILPRGIKHLLGKKNQNISFLPNIVTKLDAKNILCIICDHIQLLSLNILDFIISSPLQCNNLLSLFF